MCVFGGSRTAVEDLIRDPRGNVSVALLSAFGALALGLVVAGLLGGSETVLVALAITLGVLWAITTLRHAVIGPPATLRAG
jgi:hypothetical protein